MIRHQRSVAFLIFRPIGWSVLLTFLVGGVYGQRVVFSDTFHVPGTKLDTTRWTTERGPSSFLGRTQLADWIAPGGVGQFVVDNAGAQLALNTFNPTGDSLYGTHAKTLVAFQPRPDSTIVLTARLRLTSLQRGLVYGIYFFGCRDQVSCATQHDEIDIELVTNLLQPGAPLAVQLNSYADESLGAGNGQIVTLPAGFDPLAVHDWTIRWSRQRIEYLVDDVLLSSRTSNVPAGPMQVNVIAWAPAFEWPAAYSASLQQATSAGQNQRFTAIVNSVAVTEIGASDSDALITEYHVTGFADLEGITTGPDGAIWFAENTSGKIGRISTTGDIVKYSLGRVYSAITITAGPDGALWFAGGCIGRITTVGVITWYSDCGTYGVTAGPDGALWFTKPNANKIGRITTTGVATEFALPTVNSYPSHIKTGPDGALWFVESWANKIGRITTNGVVTEFKIPRVGIGGLASGPDGAIWFTSEFGNYIGRITATGLITEFPLWITGGLNDITSGPDGALWFASGSNEIGRITTGGGFTRYTIPTSFANPVFLTAGPDGAIWFTQNASGKIGRLDLAGMNVFLHNLANAASYSDAGVAPGEIATVFGRLIGPANLESAALDESGRLSTLIGGTRVLFDDVPAPIVYASETQTAVIVPYEAARRSRSEVKVEYGGRASVAMSVRVREAHPGLFSRDQTGRGQGAIYNDDGTPNGPSSPAARGSIVTLYGTGEGQTVPAGVNGQLATSIVPKPVLQPSVTIGGVQATDIRYYGGVPGQTAGLFQINVMVPQALAPSSEHPVQVQFGSATSQVGLTMAVR